MIGLGLLSEKKVISFLREKPYGPEGFLRSATLTDPLDQAG